MMNRRYAYGLRQLNKQFSTPRSETRLPIAWATMLREPLCLLSVRRISETYAIGIVRHFSMQRRFHVNLFPKDIAMLEAAQGITLAVGDVWKPDNKYGYIDCEVHQYIAQDDYNGYFNRFDHVEKAWKDLYQAPAEKVYYNHETWYLVASNANTVTLAAVDYDDTITVSRADFERVEDYLGFDSLRVISNDSTANNESEDAA